MQTRKTFRKTVLTLTISLIALPGFLGSAEPAQATLNLQPHSFDCGASTPPSGPYLDKATSIVWDYDCSTGMLSNPQIVLVKCTHQFVGGEHVFVGYCAITYDGQANGKFRAFIGVAEVGTYQKLDYTVHAQSGTFDEDSDEDTLTSNGVTYYEHDAGYNRIPCTQEEAHAHSTIWGTDGSDGAAHDATTIRCF